MLQLLHPWLAITCAPEVASPSSSPSRPSVGQREVCGLSTGLCPGHVLWTAVAGGGVVVPVSAAVVILRIAPRLAVDVVVDILSKTVLGTGVPSRRLPGPQSTWGS